MTLQLVGRSPRAGWHRSGFTRSLLWFSRTCAAVALATLEFRVCKEDEEEEEKSSSSSSPMSQASLVLRANSWKLEAFLLFMGSPLALERSLMKLGARGTGSEPCCWMSSFSFLSPHPHSNQTIPFSCFPVPPPRPKEYVKSLWAAHCQEWLSQAAVTAVSEATVAAHTWRGASLPGSEGQWEDRYNSSSSAFPHPTQNR